VFKDAAVTIPPEIAVQSLGAVQAIINL